MSTRVLAKTHSLSSPGVSGRRRNSSRTMTTTTGIMSQEKRTLSWLGTGTMLLFLSTSSSSSSTMAFTTTTTTKRWLPPLSRGTAHTTKVVASFSSGSSLCVPHTSRRPRQEQTRTRQTPLWGRRRPLERSVTRLSYSNSENEHEDEVSSSQLQDTSSSSSSSRRGLVIPLLGPLLQTPPLLLGAELTLDPPTLLQWKALEESAVLHFNYLQSQQPQGNATTPLQAKTDGTNTAIDAAPLVAVIDEYSGQIPIVDAAGEETGRTGRYATIAAVMGVRSGGRDMEEDDDEEDDDDESPLSTPLQMTIGGKEGQRVVSRSSSVRLVGVGRAILQDYFYRIPSPAEDADVGEQVTVSLDGDGDLFALLTDPYGMGGGEDDFSEEDEEDDDDDKENYWETLLDQTPIVMAEFQPLMDTGVRLTSKWTDIGVKNGRSSKSRLSSPVHAMAELFRMYNRIIWLHDSRRQLVAGLRAAKARLWHSERTPPTTPLPKRQQRKPGYEMSFDDYDGLKSGGGGGDGIHYQDAAHDNDFGTADNDNNDNDYVMTVDEFLEKFQARSKETASASSSSSANDDDKTAANDKDDDDTTWREAQQLQRLENYGLGYYGAFSSLSDLARVMAEQMAPYYSPAYGQREEFQLEVASFVAFRTLAQLASPEDVAWALACRSSAERLHRAFGLMRHHRYLLEQLAQDVSQELRDCGEECTDLW